MESGDSITSIAAKFDLTPTLLCKINRLHSQHLFVGQHLKVLNEEVGFYKVKESNPEPKEEFEDGQGILGGCPIFQIFSLFKLISTVNTIDESRLLFVY